jgi:ATP-dependent protease ClpP protease subunit
MERCEGAQRNIAGHGADVVVWTDTDRDFFMTPEEARDYGIIDEVIQTKKSNLPKPAKPVLT